MQTTTNMGLSLPEQGDSINVGDFNSNFVKLDDGILSDSVRGIKIMTESEFSEITPDSQTLYYIRDDDTGLLQAINFGTSAIWERGV